jgi:hypothetical protein
MQFDFFVSSGYIVKTVHQFIVENGIIKNKIMEKIMGNKISRNIVRAYP